MKRTAHVFRTNGQFRKRKVRWHRSFPNLGKTRAGLRSIKFRDPTKNARAILELDAGIKFKVEATTTDKFWDD